MAYEVSEARAAPAESKPEKYQVLHRLYSFFDTIGLMERATGGLLKSAAELDRLKAYAATHCLSDDLRASLDKMYNALAVLAEREYARFQNDRFLNARKSRPRWQPHLWGPLTPHNPTNVQLMDRPKEETAGSPHITTLRRHRYKENINQNSEPQWTH
jgi:hypothetical protein